MKECIKVYPCNGQVNKIHIDNNNYAFGCNNNKVIKYNILNSTISYLNTSSQITSINDIVKINILKEDLLCIGGNSNIIDIYLNNNSDSLFNLYF